MLAQNPQLRHYRLKSSNNYQTPFQMMHSATNRIASPLLFSSDGTARCKITTFYLQTLSEAITIALFLQDNLHQNRFYAKIR